jgi:hypothetical protein
MTPSGYVICSREFNKERPEKLRKISRKLFSRVFYYCSCGNRKDGEVNMVMPFRVKSPR